MLTSRLLTSRLLTPRLLTRPLRAPRRSRRHQFTLVAAAVAVTALLSPPAYASAPSAPGTDAAPASSVMATSLSFAGYRTPVPPSTATQTVVQVATTGPCPAGWYESVAVGAEQKGSSGLLGARIYSQCLGGTPVISPVFETTSATIPMTTIGALAPGDMVVIWISTTAGTTTVTVQGPLGTDSMSTPDIISAGYRVGIWPLFDTHAQAKMQNFGTLMFYKNTINTQPLGTSPWTRVHLVYGSGPVRAKASPLNPWGDTFKVKWFNT